MRLKFTVEPQGQAAGGAELEGVRLVRDCPAAMLENRRRLGHRHVRRHVDSVAVTSGGADSSVGERYVQLITLVRFDQTICCR